MTNQIQPIEYKEVRVLTTAQLAGNYGTDSDKISYNFNYNEKRYHEGKHFFLLVGDDLKEFKKANREFQGSLNKLYLWTKKGAWLHAKSLNTDEAWDAYEMLVDDYYDKLEQLQQIQPMSQWAMMAEYARGMDELTKKQNMLELKTNNLEEKVENLSKDFKEYTIREGDISGYIIARELNLFSESEKPHFNFVDAIAKQLKIYSGDLGDQNDYVNVVMDNTHMGTSGVATYYTQKSLELIRQYLNDKLDFYIVRYKRNSGVNKKGDPMIYSYRVGSKDWKFHERTYFHWKYNNLDSKFYQCNAEETQELLH